MTAVIQPFDPDAKVRRRLKRPSGRSQSPQRHKELRRGLAAIGLSPEADAADRITSVGPVGNLLLIFSIATGRVEYAAPGVLLHGPLQADDDE